MTPMQQNAKALAPPRPSSWAACDIENISRGAIPVLPEIELRHVKPIIPGVDLWDLWPLRRPDGQVAAFGGRTLWFALSAPAVGDPELRHGAARIRLLLNEHGSWIDCGPALPEGFSPGSREWSGSAVLESDSCVMTLYFTVAGRRGETQTTFEQRLFEARGDLVFEGGRINIKNWRGLMESVVSDDRDYVLVNQREGAPGIIKAFRDPEYFRDPADGREHLIFCASLKQTKSRFNGVVGLATKDASGIWRLAPPLICAEGVNNELERPHVLVSNGQYYMFWSTQRRTFSPDGPMGPNGLYGMAAETLLGPYRPLNGTGLVAANPESAPAQTYAWLVLPSLEVISFIDYWGMEGPAANVTPERRRVQFGGAPSPVFKIALDGDRTQIVEAW
jgi:levansucrase